MLNNIDLSSLSTYGRLVWKKKKWKRLKIDLSITNPVVVDSIPTIPLGTVLGPFRCFNHSLLTTTIDISSLTTYGRIVRKKKEWETFKMDRSMTVFMTKYRPCLKMDLKHYSRPNSLLQQILRHKNSDCSSFDTDGRSAWKKKKRKIFKIDRSIAILDADTVNNFSK